MNTVSNSNFIMKAIKKKHEQFKKEHAELLTEEKQVKQNITIHKAGIHVLKNKIESLQKTHEKNEEEKERLKEEFVRLSELSALENSEEINQDFIQTRFKMKEVVLSQMDVETHLEEQKQNKRRFESALKNEQKKLEGITNALPYNPYGIALQIANKYKTGFKHLDTFSEVLETLETVLQETISIDISITQGETSFYISEIKIGEVTSIQATTTVIREKVDTWNGAIEGYSDICIPVLDFEYVQDIYKAFSMIPKQKLFVNTILNNEDEMKPTHIYIVNDESARPETDFIKIHTELDFVREKNQIQIGFSEFPYDMEA